MSIFKKILAFLSVLLIKASVFAAEWYVCLGSFKSYDNAKNLYDKMSAKNLPVKIAEHKKDGEVLYRVIYGESKILRDDARKLRDQIITKKEIKSLGLNGLWICEVPVIILSSDVSPEKESKVVSALVEEPAVKSEEKPALVKQPSSKSEEKVFVEPEVLEKEIEKGEALFIQDQEIVLSANNDEIPLSEEKPYSVLIGSYKEEQPANRDKERLKEKNIDAYVVKTYDEESLFSFDLHTGAFKSFEEAEVRKEELEQLGVYVDDISYFDDVEDKIDLYDKKVKENKIVFETGSADLPDLMSEPIIQLIKQFPVNKDFQINSILIVDLNNWLAGEENLISAIEDNDGFIFSMSEMTGSKDGHVDAMANVSYVDSLFDRKVEIAVVAVDKTAVENANDKIREMAFENNVTFNSVKLLSNGNIFDCKYASIGDDVILYGTNQSQNLFVKMLCYEYSEEMFKEFLSHVENDGNLLIYPQFRKSLYILPDGRKYGDSDFMCYKFERVGYQYAIDKGNARWAKQIVGHWLIDVTLSKNNINYSIEFFDMDYDFNAKMNQEEFEAAHTVWSDTNHPCLITPECSGWYVESWNNPEVSFAKKSFSIAVDASYESGLRENELIDIARELRIWK